MGNVSTDGGNNWGGLGRVCGGNAAEGKGESHGGGRANRVGIGPKESKGAMGTFGPTRQGGDGNEPVTGEKHGNMGAFRDGGKVSGSEFVLDLGRPKGGKLIPTSIQVDDRGADTSGNCSNGGREKQGQRKAERVTASQRW